MTQPTSDFDEEVRTDNQEPHNTKLPDQTEGAPRQRQLAELVARGEIPFPTDLDRDAQRRLLRSVRELLRRRLIRLVARAIANDIASTPN